VTKQPEVSPPPPYTATMLDDARLAKLREQARREAGSFVDPRQLARVTAFVATRRAWATAVIGRPFNPRTMTCRDLVLLDLAAHAEPNPPVPPRLARPGEPGYVLSDRERLLAQHQRDMTQEWEQLKAALPFDCVVAHNYQSRHHYEFYVQGADHIIVWEAVHVGRLHRAKGDALCETPSRSRSLYFPHAYIDRKEFYPSCKTCVRIAARITGHSVDTLLRSHARSTRDRPAEGRAHPPLGTTTETHAPGNDRHK
jgi:hypothetical protein